MILVWVNHLAQRMGLPLGATIANILMCFKQNKWLPDHRYIDDTFLLFRCCRFINQRAFWSEFHL